jgi:hypothetical protein
MPHPEKPALRLCMIILLIFLIILPSRAQTDRRFAYFGKGMILAAATALDDPNIFHFCGYSFFNGGGYDVMIRQEVNDFLSIESGLNIFGFSMGYNYLDEKTEQSGLWSHNIPLKAELEVDLLKDRIALYASFGLQFNYADHTSFGWRTLYMDNGELDQHKYYLPKSRIYSRYLVGSGARFCIVDQLIFELELGMGTGS